MKKDLTSYLIVSIMVIVTLGCSFTASTPTEPSENLPTSVQTEPIVANDIRPTSVRSTPEDVLDNELIEPTEIISTGDNESPLSIGLWRFEAESNVENGKREYKAYVWLSANDIIVTLKYALADHIRAEDFGLCDIYGYHPENPRLITEEGNTYETGMLGCYLMAVQADKIEFLLYPGVRMLGMMEWKPYEFYYEFDIPYQETPKEIVFPPLNLVVPLPNVNEGPYVEAIPEHDLTRMTGFKTPVNVVDTFEMSVEDIQIRELEDDLYLAITHIRIVNLDPNLSFEFEIHSDLIDDNGYYLEPHTNFMSPHEDLVDRNLCSNNGGRYNSADIEVPAGGETVAVQCFIGDRNLRILNADRLMAWPEQMVFVMTIEEITLAFAGAPILP